VRFVEDGERKSCERFGFNSRKQCWSQITVRQLHHTNGVEKVFGVERGSTVLTEVYHRNRVLQNGEVYMCTPAYCR
jgi:ribosomal protein L19